MNIEYVKNPMVIRVDGKDISASVASVVITTTGGGNALSEIELRTDNGVEEAMKR